jgi:hypothetical protein
VTQLKTTPEATFFSRYVKAFSAAALAFGLTHGVQAIAVSTYRYGSGYPRLDALFTLAFFEGIEGLTFFAVGMIALLIPARLVGSHFGRAETERGDLFCWLGVLAALVFLPLCAGISVSILPEAGDPTYLERCWEYLLPMTVAGFAGGYVFGSLGKLAPAKH